MIHILTDKKLKALLDKTRSEGFADATLKAYELGFALGQVSQRHQGIILQGNVSEQIENMQKYKEF
uniref:Uncharacterized protein n=1 Tax=viral metagenome TaxID=1070528 RepID=A0A6M3LLL2_9ZZZZ